MVNIFWSVFVCSIENILWLSTHLPHGTMKNSIIITENVDNNSRFLLSYKDPPAYFPYWSGIKVNRGVIIKMSDVIVNYCSLCLSRTFTITQAGTRPLLHSTAQNFIVVNLAADRVLPHSVEFVFNLLAFENKYVIIARFFTKKPTSSVLRVFGSKVF